MEFVLRDYKDAQGNVLAHALAPEDYLTGASISNVVQHESVPFFIAATAVNNEKNIRVIGLSDERFTTYKNKMMSSALRMMTDVKWNSIKDFMEPEVYLDQFACKVAGMSLVALGEADLPSMCGKNVNQAYQDFMAEYQASFQRDAALGTEVKANNSLFRCFMRRYSGKDQNGREYAVLAGMDYNGIEYYSPASALAAVNPLLGLLGSAVKQNQAKKSSPKLGHGTPCDAIDWGAKNRFFMMCPSEYENEGANAFLQFVQTFHMDNALRQRFYELNTQRVQMRMQETARFQGMAQASMQSLMINQQRLANTLAQNSAAMSDMIMDSWNQKMASDSRISQARTEAIMGTNTYVNSYGQSYDVSVTADHVYQNNYGDVIGVSGVAPDQETLNQLNWKELGK